MANKRHDREENAHSKDKMQSGSPKSARMQSDRDTREQHSSGKSGGRPDEKMANRSSAKGSSGDMGRDVGVPSRQTSTASEEEGQL